MPNPERDSRVSYFRIPKPVVNLPYRIRRVGRNRYINYHSTHGTYNQDATINIFVDGIGHYYKGDKHIVARKGDVLLVTGDSEPGFLFADKKKPYDLFYCRFTGYEAIRVARRISHNYGKGRDVFAWDNWQQGVDCFDRMLAHWSENVRQPDDRLTVADAVLAQLLAELDSVETTERAIVNADMLNAYMLDRIHDNIDLEEMAGYFGISKSHLCRLGKIELGQPIGKTWEQIKIEWAKTLLLETKSRIAEVAFHIGFHDQFYFSRVFKKHTGMSPKLWLKENSQKK